MTVTVTCKCDRCDEVQQSRLDSGGFTPLWNIAITCEPIDLRDKYVYSTRHQSAQWCNKCVEGMGVRRPLIAADVENKPPTLEDIIRDIVRQEQQG